MNREDEWREGFHTTAVGKKLRLSEMEETHLINTINRFHRMGDWDTRPLSREVHLRHTKNR
jgi:hypothetical protein